MKTWLIVWLLLWGSVHAAAPAADAPPAPEAPSGGALASDGPPFDLLDPQRITKGEGRFGATCAAYCHGSGGTGGRAPSFRDRSDFSPSFAFQTIHDGRRGADIMPPWGNAFSTEEIWELVAYLQHLSRQPE